MILNSMRGRLVIWLAFLLVCILTGFGVTVFSLQRQNRMNQIDSVLQLRLAALSADARERLPLGPVGFPRETREAREARDPDFLDKTNTLDISSQDLPAA